MLFPSLGSVLVWCAPALASAHAFGQQYSLPLPLNLYIAGGVCAFLASCALLIFLKKGRVVPELIVPIPEKVFDVVRTILSWGVLAILGVCLVVGLFGPSTSYDNLLVIVFWIGLVLVVPYSAVLVDGLWEFSSPFKRVGSFFAKRQVNEWSDGYWHAVAGYAVLIVLELFLSQYSTTPKLLSVIILVYTVWLGVAVMWWGLTWLNYGEVFTVFIRTVGTIASLRIEEGKLVLASPATRLATATTSHLSLVVFILFGLAATAYDGIRDTLAWFQLLNPIPFGTFADTSLFSFVVLPLLFFGLYAGAMYAMQKLVGEHDSVERYMLRFAFSLIPIMIAYHFAHYFELIFTTGAYAIPLISDPFALGWNLFGTAAIDASRLIGAQAIWYVQFVTIVGAHIFAAYVAHRIALMEFVDHRRALLSQLPLIVLMVFYTAFGLWILGQPYMPPV